MKIRSVATKEYVAPEVNVCEFAVESGIAVSEVVTYSLYDFYKYEMLEMENYMDEFMF